MRKQLSALQAVRSCSDDQSFQSWHGDTYWNWDGVEADKETLQVTKLLLPSRNLKVRLHAHRSLQADHIHAFN